jgi:hypothetical protein
MNKLRLYSAIIVLIAISGYITYQLYFPAMVAKSIVSESSFVFPKSLSEKISKIRGPVNVGVSSIVETVHHSGLTIDDILLAIDNATEEQANALLDELNSTEITDADHFFDLVKKHFPVPFDVEVFREPFKQKITIRQIRKGIIYANIYKERDEIDAQTAKSIAKRILLQKEEELKHIVNP